MPELLICQVVRSSRACTASLRAAIFLDLRCTPATYQMKAEQWAGCTVRRPQPLLGSVTGCKTEPVKNQCNPERERGLFSVLTAACQSSLETCSGKLRQANTKIHYIVCTFPKGSQLPFLFNGIPVALSI